MGAKVVPDLRRHSSGTPPNRSGRGHLPRLVLLVAAAKAQRLLATLPADLHDTLLQFFIRQIHTHISGSACIGRDITSGWISWDCSLLYDTGTMSGVNPFSGLNSEHHDSGTGAIFSASA